MADGGVDGGYGLMEVRFRAEDAHADVLRQAFEVVAMYRMLSAEVCLNAEVEERRTDQLRGGLG